MVGSDVPPLPLFPSYPLPEPEEPGGCPPTSNPSLGQTREGGAETLRFVPLEQGLSPHFKSKPHIDLENRISRFDNSFKEDAMTCSQKCRAATALAHLQRQSKWRAVLWKCGHLLNDRGDQKNLAKNRSDRDRDGQLCNCQVSPGSTQMYSYCKLINKAGIIHQKFFWLFWMKTSSQNIRFPQLHRCEIRAYLYLYVQFYQTVFLSSPFRIMTAFGLVCFTKFADYLMFVRRGVRSDAQLSCTETRFQKW